MSTQRIEKDRLKDYFDHFSMIMPAELIEIEVAGLDLGDQVQADWVPLSGISYDPKNDVVVVDLNDGQVQHSIRAPVEVEVEEDDEGIRSIGIRCGEGHLHVLRLKEPKALPVRD